MHISLIIAIALTAWTIRWIWTPSDQAWDDRWADTLKAFLLPPLLLLSIAIAIIFMGSQGHMLGLSVGQVGYSLAWIVLGYMGLTLVISAILGIRSLYQIQRYPQIPIPDGLQGRLLDTSLLFAGQVGFWNPELVISQGLINTLSPEQLTAVITHEQAHYRYRDTFWFFWLGWVKQMTSWLPNTNTLWQELLLLREMRADAWAAQTVDPLDLAEALLLTVQSPFLDVDSPGLAVGVNSSSRLEIRVNALIDLSTNPHTPPRIQWNWLLVVVLPLATVLLHS